MSDTKEKGKGRWQLAELNIMYLHYVSIKFSTHSTNSKNLTNEPIFHNHVYIPSFILVPPTMMIHQQRHRRPGLICRMSLLSLTFILTCLTFENLMNTATASAFSHTLPRQPSLSPSGQTIRLPIILMIFTVTNGIRVFDCQDPKSTHQVLDLLAPKSCPDPIRDYLNATEESVQILMTDTSYPTLGYQCLVQVTTKVTRCGFNSITYGSVFTRWEKMVESTPQLHACEPPTQLKISITTFKPLGDFTKGSGHGVYTAPRHPHPSPTPAYPINISMGKYNEIWSMVSKQTLPTPPPWTLSRNGSVSWPPGKENETYLIPLWFSPVITFWTVSTIILFYFSQKGFILIFNSIFNMYTTAVLKPILEA